MWRTPDGMTHTVGLPDASYLFSVRALADIRQLAAAAPDELADLVEDLEDAEFDRWSRVPVRPAKEKKYVADVPPARSLTGKVPDLARLRKRVHEVDVRWRLDVLMAIEDLLP